MVPSKVETTKFLNMLHARQSHGYVTCERHSCASSSMATPNREQMIVNKYDAFTCGHTPIGKERARPSTFFVHAWYNCFWMQHRNGMTRSSCILPWRVLSPGCMRRRHLRRRL
mmetsp:Transcript_22435/g.55796  ORF Transcript_22435/g.55796 Transcript_22435/m.55796 type:complete len:113 (-) Transcript_22435:181-519(-)